MMMNTLMVDGKEAPMEMAICVTSSPFCVISCHQHSPTAVDCVGSWDDCTVSCGSGTQTYTITTAAANGGATCEVANQATQECNTQDCPGQSLQQTQPTTCSTTPEVGPWQHNLWCTTLRSFSVMRWWETAQKGTVLCP